MQIFKEALQKVGVFREEQPKPFEQARKVMEEKGGRKLILGVAEELKENGDSSAIVVEERDATTNILTLRYGLERATRLFPTAWVSRGVVIVAEDTGRVSVEVSSFPDTRVPLRWAVDLNNSISKISNRGYTPPIKLENKSLEEQFRLAMELASAISDFRYGEGEQSLKQKPVKNKLSKRIF